MKNAHQRTKLGAVAGLILIVAWAATVEVAQADSDAEAEETPSADDQAKVRDTIAACRSRFEEVDTQIDQAGVRDVGYYRVPGYPYMRSDRLLASFGVGELKKMDPLGDWLHQLRDNEGFSRDIELQNLGLSVRERITLLSELRLCAVWLSNFELVNEASREKLVTLVQVPAEPSKRKGQPGPGPLESSDVARELKQRAEDVRASFAVPTADLDSPGTLVLWKAKPYTLGPVTPADGFAGAVRDALGRVGLTENQWELLANRFAPSFLIETAGKLDRIGTPSRGEQRPFVDVSRPVVDFQADYARLGSQSLIQFNYFVWFPGRAPDGTRGAGNATLDGLIWRVTLDANGQPLVYDTIHASGFDHLWFPLPALTLRRDVQGDTVLSPQPEVPAQFVVRLRAGRHEVRRLVAAEDVRASEVQEFELRRYEKLLTLPLPGGGTGSLFGPDGTVTASDAEKGPRSNASGSAWTGPIRQWGHHPTSLRADLYFDDPRLLEKHFMLAPSSLGVLDVPSGKGVVDAGG